MLQRQPGTTVGFCGLGNMGWPMAACLARARHPVSAWTATAGKAARWAGEHGGEAAATPAEVAGEVVVVMVGDGEQVLDVVLGDAGLVRHWEGPRLLVVASTVGRACLLELRRRLPDAWSVVDAPVSGGVGKAQDGTLTLIVGGEDADVEAVRPVLSAMGSRVEHVGGLGQGQVFKLVNNAVGMANVATAAQALVLGDALGADPPTLLRVLRASSAASTMLDLTGETMLARDWTTRFKLSHMLKDVRLCLDEAHAAGVSFPAAAQAEALLVAALERGLGERDFAAVLEVVEAAADRASGTTAATEARR